LWALTTLIGLQDLPGDLAGWGSVCAGIARETTAQIAENARAILAGVLESAAGTRPK
jgi:hypothetical protein